MAKKELFHDLVEKWFNTPLPFETAKTEIEKINMIDSGT